MQKQVDLTLEDDASGSEVVEMVIAKISKIFDSDHRLLRRIAYVETDDGTSGVPPGGIWAVDEPKLKIVLTEPELVELHDEIDQEFEIEFNTTEFTFLGKPLVSGLVACLYLYYLEIVKGETIPLAAAIGEQAQFWYSNYYSGAKGLAVDDFKRKVTKLEKREGQFLIGPWIMF